MEWDNLSKLNQFLIKKISEDFLGITTELKDVSEYAAEGAKLDLLLNQLQEAGAERYVSGPAAQDYIDERRFAESGIELVYKDYSGYPEYPQRFPPFEHQVTVLDLLFNCGPDAPYYIWGWREESRGE